jgi:hypothetical protein
MASIHGARRARGLLGSGDMVVVASDEWRLGSCDPTEQARPRMPPGSTPGRSICMWCRARHCPIVEVKLQFGRRWQPCVVSACRHGRYALPTQGCRPEHTRSAGDLLATADVVVQGYRSGALDAFGLGADALAERVPGLVIVELNRGLAPAATARAARTRAGGADGRPVAVPGGVVRARRPGHHRHAPRPRGRFRTGLARGDLAVRRRSAALPGA